MCGRFFSDENENARIKNIYKQIKENYPDVNVKSGEIFPTDIVPIIQSNLAPMPQKWGIKNKYNEKINVINSRSENITKNTFKEYFNKYRIVVPCSGYYEWSKNKEKYYFAQKDEQLMFMCAISTGNGIDDSFSIITTNAINDFHLIHDRMPLILKENEVKQYLNDYDFALYKLSHNYSDNVEIR